MAEFDDTEQLVEGADPTAEWGAYASLLLQLIREAVPALKYGWLIKSTETPPTTGDDEWRKRCLWFKIDEKAWYYYDDDLGSWEDLETSLRNYGLVTAESLTLAAFSLAMANSRQMLRKNVANTAYEWIDPTDIFEAGEVPLSWLETDETGLPDRIIRTNGDGQWVIQEFGAYLAGVFANPTVPLSTVYNDASASLNQVVTLAADNALTLQWPDTLMRANSIPTDRLRYAAGMAGKIAKINAGGTDIEGVDPVTLVSQVKAAVIRYTDVADSAPQTLSAGATATVLFNAETDPSGIVTLASNTITLAAGTYVFDVIVPIRRLAVNSTPVVVILRDSTAGADLATATGFNAGGGGDFSYVILKHTIVIAAGTNDYLIQARSSEDIDLGVKANLGGYAETYQQITITKIA